MNKDEYARELPALMRKQAMKAYWENKAEYRARTTLAERVADYLMVVELQAKPNIFMKEVDTTGYDVVWSAIQVNEASK